MSKFNHLFKLNQKVKCCFDGKLYQGIITEIYDDYIIVDVNGISDHCYFESGFNMDMVYPIYN